MGLTDVAVVVRSDGVREKIVNPKWHKSAGHALARAQRALSRKQKGSKNWEKARHRVAVLHRKVREARRDHHHKLARRLIDENQVVAVEGLDVAALMRTRMAKSVQDAGWGILVRLLHEKAVEQHREVAVVDRWQPTSQVCAVCGTKDGRKPLHVRVWTCRSCSAVLDRDFNAAVNIMIAAGLAEILNACGGDVRRTLACADPDEAGTHRTDRLRATA
ncbi:transposase [Kocuria flava]|nr:transposase [Kocuria flava]